ncbi:MAG TPA: hypothetical protein VJI15_03460 [Candidatus Nanoarchaeia archaeon]|nr:hypothetical protein [Candidatus Nanoarchaeia archaeon]
MKKEAERSKNTKIIKNKDILPLQDKDIVRTKEEDTIRKREEDDLMVIFLSTADSIRKAEPLTASAETVRKALEENTDNPSDNNLSSDSPIKENKDLLLGDFYRRLAEEKSYALGGILSPTVDYLQLWGYSSEEKRGSVYPAGAHFRNTLDYCQSSGEERVGALTEQHAQSILERMLKMKQFGDDPSWLTPDEKERYENWEHFSCNKALRNLWKATSTMRYDQFLPLLMDDVREVA